MVASWLLDLTAAALLEDPALAEFAGRVSDSGDLAHKKIFPALQVMAKRGHLNVPVIGVAGTTNPALKSSIIAFMSCAETAA